MSGMTVKRAVSSLRRNQAIFSREESAAVSSGLCLAQCIRHSKTSQRQVILAKVRMFLSSVRNRILARRQSRRDAMR